MELKDFPEKIKPELHRLKDWGIDTPIKLAHFLSQCHHESGGFNIVSENLNYSAERLQIVFPKHFNKGNVLFYANQPEKIANKVYANRMSNGNEATGDGFRYKGRGYIQLTGAANYLLFGNSINEKLLQFPELVAVKYPLISAAWFFKRNVLPKITDSSTVKEVTKLVNGGQHGLTERQNLFNQYLPLCQKHYI